MRYASFLSVQPRSSSLDTVQTDEDGCVRAIKCMKDANIWVNGGYFVLRKEIFRYIKPGEELVYEPFQRLISEGKVWSQRYSGFWQCMDTFRDKQILDELEASGDAPWCLWKNGHSAAGVRRVIRLTFCAKRQTIPFSCFALARIRTTSRLVAVEHCCISNRAFPRLRFHWVVFSAAGIRGQEAAKAAELFTAGCEKEIVLKDYRDGFLPYNGARVKDFFEEIKASRESGPDFHSLAAAMRTRTIACSLSSPGTRFETI